jgi:thiol:disulfide interchange protein DsbC
MKNFVVGSVVRSIANALLVAVALTCMPEAKAQEADLRGILAQRLPQLPPIESVSRAPVSGLYEVVLQGGQIIYADRAGDFIVQGSIYDVQRKLDLTEQRLQALSAIRFDDLPIRDSFVVVRGKGSRKLAVFEDPNCGFCKRFERDLAQIDNVTVHVFLLPILGPDSRLKSRNIWCARDRAASFLNWMTQDRVPAEARCDEAVLDRLLAFGRKARINATPTLVFADGTRLSGALPSSRIEAMLEQHRR